MQNKKSTLNLISQKSSKWYLKPMSQFTIFFPLYTSSRATSETPEKAIFSVNTKPKDAKVKGTNDSAGSPAASLRSHLFHYYKGPSQCSFWARVADQRGMVLWK